MTAVSPSKGALISTVELSNYPSGGDGLGIAVNIIHV